MELEGGVEGCVEGGRKGRGGRGGGIWGRSLGL